MAQDEFVDRDTIARYMGVDPRTITNWVRDSDFPSRMRGKSRVFPVGKCIQWKADRAAAEAAASMAPPPADGMFEAERRKAIADAELAELKVKKFKSELVEASVVGKEVARAYDRVAARLKSTPGEFAPQLLQQQTMPEVVSILRRLIATALSSLQTEFASDEDDASADDGDDAAEGAA